MTHDPQHVDDVTEVLPGLATQATRDQRFTAVAALTLASLFSGIVIAALVVTALEGSGSVVTQSELLKKLKRLSQEKDFKTETLKELVATERKHIESLKASGKADEASLESHESFVAHLSALAEAQDPRTEKLREIFRAEDARIRLEHKLRRLRMGVGAMLLLLGVVAIVVSARRYLSLDEALPKPPKHEASTGTSGEPSFLTLGVVTVIALAAVLVVTFIALHDLWVPDVPTKADKGPGKTVTDTRPVAVEYRDNWPGFRGPTGMGTVKPGNWPTKWNAETADNILWKTELPLEGNSSPVLWGQRIFLTAADAKRQLVLCCDRTNGKILWQKEISSAENKRRLLKGEAGAVQVSEDTGYAAPTGVTDGKCFYVFFATADYAAVDFDGNVKWVKNLGPVENMYGLSSSLARHDDMLLLLLDQSKRSTLYGIDPASGEVLWPTDRPSGSAWGSPVVVDTGKRKLILTAAEPWVIAYDAATGDELWRFDGLMGDVGATPVYADGLVYAADAGQVIAIRTGGSGTVTKTHKAWVSEDAASDAPSVVTNGKHLLVTQNQSSDAACLDAKTGKLLWIHEFKTGYYASPVLAGNVVYLTDTRGRTQLFKLSEKWTGLIAENDLGEDVFASPAFGDDRIYIRGKQHLFCIGTRGK